MLDRLSVKRPPTQRRFSDVSSLSKAKEASTANGLLVPKSGTKSAGNSNQSLASSPGVSVNSLYNAATPPSPPGRKSVSFNHRVQIFDHLAWKKQLKRYRKIARKLAEKKDQVIKSKEGEDSDDSSSEEEDNKSEASQGHPPARTPPKISFN